MLCYLIVFLSIDLTFMNFQNIAKRPGAAKLALSAILDSMMEPAILTAELARVCDWPATEPLNLIGEARINAVFLTKETRKRS